MGDLQLLLHPALLEVFFEQLGVLEGDSALAREGLEQIEILRREELARFFPAERDDPPQFVFVRHREHQLGRQ